MPVRLRLLARATALTGAFLGLLLIGTRATPLTLTPPFLRWATPGILATSDLIRTLSPWVLSLGLCSTVAVYAIAQTKGRLGATATLAIEGIPGSTSWTRRWLSASVLTVAMVGAVNASLSAVEQAITEGPSSAVTEGLLDTLGLENNAGGILVLAQHKHLSFMDTSHITAPEADRLLAACHTYGDTFVPFALDLPYIDSPEGGFNGLRITTVDPNREPAVVASSTVAAPGDEIRINGQPSRVTATGPAGLDFINRTTIVQTTPQLDRPYWGLFVVAPSADLEPCADETAGLAAITVKQLTANNRSFWERNGTPILLVLTLVLMLITALLAIKDRAAQLEHQQEPLTALRLATIDRTWPLMLLVSWAALIDVSRALVLVLPASLAINAMFNAATFGLKTEMSTGLAVAYTLAVIPSIAGAVIALRRQLRVPISAVLRSGAP